MADSLSPLINLDLVNRIYKTISAQIAERVYDPQYNTAATLGDTSHRYVNAYLKALNVKGDTLGSGNISTEKLNDLTLTAASKGFTISGGTTPKTLTIADATTISNSLTVSAATNISANTTISAELAISAATSIAKKLTVSAAATIGAANTGDVEIKSAGINKTTIIGPDNGSVTFITPTGDIQGTVRIGNNSSTSGTSTIGVSAGKYLKAYTDTEIGSKTNIGKVSIQPNGTSTLTINGPTNGAAVNLISGTYQNSATIACSTANTINNIVQRDGSGDILVGNVNGVKLGSAATGFTATGGATSKTLTVNSTATLGSTSSTENGDVIVKSAGTGTTTIKGPSGKVATLVDGTYTSSATTNNSDTPTAGSLLKIKNIPANTFLAGPSLSTEADAAPTYREINSNDLTDVVAGAAKKFETPVEINGTDFDGSTPITTDKWGKPRDITIADLGSTHSMVNKSIDGSNNFTLNLPSDIKANTFIGSLTGNADTASQIKTKTITANSKYFVSFVSRNNDSALDESVYTSADLTYNPSTKTLSATKFSGTLAGNASTATSASNSTIKDWNAEDETTYYVPAVAGTGNIQPLYASTSGVKITRKVDSADPVYHLYAGAVHNAVWNDLADCIEVPEDTDLEFGHCYSWNGDKVEKTSRKSKNCIGIHSNTAGLFMGEKPVKTIQAAVAGFALAYTDKVYPEGTPLTWSDDGKLTKCSLLKRLVHPERIIATFYKEESQESWHGVKVNNRHWVKVR